MRLKRLKVKRVWYIITLLLMVAIIFTACTKDENFSGDEEEKIKIIATTFPSYDWMREIIGEESDGLELTLLMDKGVDLHSFQPSIEEISNIKNSDLLIYVGGTSDKWVDDLLAINETDLTAIGLMNVLGDGIKEEVIVEGMEHDHEDHEHEGELDEHLWLSLKNAGLFSRAFAQKLGEIDPDNAEVYKKNADSYIEKLEILDNQFREVVEKAPNKYLIFGDRFPFRYLVDDYGLDCYAAFSGCSTEIEASFETISFLSNKMDELKLASILVIDNSDQKIATTILNNSKDPNRKILVLDSMQSVNSSDIKSGTTYLSIMEKNLKILEESLN